MRTRWSAGLAMAIAGAATTALCAGDAGVWHPRPLLAGTLGALVVAALLALAALILGSERVAGAHAALRRRADEIERATEAKSRFVASLSHELRAPLSAVTGFTELLRQGRAGLVSSAQREYLDIVQSAADHLLALIDEALDLSAIEAGHLRLRTAATEPAAIARECIAALSAVAAARDVEVILVCPVAGPAMLDADRLRQVLLNYLSNAIKFSPTAGSVVVRLGHDVDRLTIAVTDDGVGIAADDHARVFEEFAQVGDGAAVGHGLGLAVTRRIVEAQGGEVAVHSAPGAGSTFTAWLPWVTVGAAPPDPGSAIDPWAQLVAGLAPYDERVAPAAAVSSAQPARGRRAAARASRTASAPAERP